MAIEPALGSESARPAALRVADRTSGDHRQDVMRAIPSQAAGRAVSRFAAGLHVFDPFRSLGMVEWLRLIDDIWLRLLPPTRQPAREGVREHIERLRQLDVTSVGGILDKYLEADADV